MKKNAGLFQVYLILQCNPEWTGTLLCTRLKNPGKIFLIAGKPGILMVDKGLDLT
jgi:hypothetical protein